MIRINQGPSWYHISPCWCSEASPFSTWNSVLASSTGGMLHSFRTSKKRINCQESRDDILSSDVAAYLFGRRSVQFWKGWGIFHSFYFGSTIFNFFSLAKVGYAICVIDIYMGMFYNTIIGWAVYYFVARWVKYFKTHICEGIVRLFGIDCLLLCGEVSQVFQSKSLSNNSLQHIKSLSLHQRMISWVERKSKRITLITLTFSASSQQGSMQRIIKNKFK